MGLRRQHSPIGLDLSGRELRAVQLRRRHGGWTVRATASLRRADPDAPLSAEDLERLGRVLSRRRFVGHEVVTAMPADQIVSSIFARPEESGTESAASLVQASLQRTTKLPLEAAEVAWWDLPSTAGARTASEVMAVACGHEQANSMMDLLEGTGYQVIGLDIESAAVTRWQRLADLSSEGLQGIIIVEWGYLLVVMTYQGRVVYQRQVNEAGLRHLYEILDNRAGITGEMADVIIREYADVAEQPGGSGGTPLGPEMTRAMSEYFSAVVRELESSVAYVGHRYPDAASDGVVLAGTCADVAGLRRVLSATIESGPGNVDVKGAPDETEAGSAAGVAAEFAVAAGLAMYGSE